MGARRWVGRNGWLSSLEAGLVLVGIAVAGTIAAVTQSNLSTFERDYDAGSATYDIAQHLTRSHLAMEAHLDGDTSVDVTTGVLGQLGHAASACAGMADASRHDRGWFQPTIDRATRSEIDDLCADIAELSRLAEAVAGGPGDVGAWADAARFHEVFERLLEDNAEVRGEVLGLVGEHQRTAVLLYGVLTTVPFLAGLAFAFLVRRHRRATETATGELAMLASIVNSSPDAIISNSTDGIVTTWNPGAERLFGWTAEEIVGRDVRVLLTEQRRDREVLERVRRGEQITRESERRHKDGSVVPVSLTLAPVYEDGVMTGLASIQRDMTERHAKDAALAAAREEALEASALKSEFLATMSHEIRTPMNGVVGLTSLLLETPLNDLQRQYAEGVRGAGEALLTVINDILDFSKLEAGKVELESTRFDLRRLVEEVATLLAPAAQVKGLELITFCTPGVPAGLVGDPGRIRQVLLNLASNAVKFTPAGEVAITVRSETLEVGSVLVRIEVSDTGVGVSTADAERLFDSFTQADASTTRKFGGTGLGLAISRHLVDLMGGEIGVHGREGGGSTFWAQLPLCTSDSGSPDDSPVWPHELLEGIRVLVVDGNATSRAALESQLSDWGMRPYAVETGARALDVLSRASDDTDPYAVALVSSRLPDMNGLELSRLIGEPDSVERPSVLLLTPSLAVVPQDLAASGVHGWLTKPVRTSDLRNRLLKMVAPAATPNTSAAPGQQEPDAQEPRGRVLVVEDNMLNQMVAEGMLSALGYDVDVATNGAEALAAVAAGTYVAVLMDCHMPVMDGFEATREIRRRTADERLPIIAMTAAAMVEDKDRCLEAGMDDYVSKPVDIQALETVLVRWIRAGNS